MKDSLKAAVVALARERGCAIGARAGIRSSLAGGGGGGAEAARRALHNELYCLLDDETRAALAALASAPTWPAAALAAAPAPSGAEAEAAGQASEAAVTGSADAALPAANSECPRGEAGQASLLELAEDCEAEGDHTRAHLLHQQRAAGAAGADEAEVGRPCGGGAVGSA